MRLGEASHFFRQVILFDVKQGDARLFLRNEDSIKEAPT